MSDQKKLLHRLLSKAESRIAELEYKLKHGSMCELSADNLNLKHWADHWEKRVQKAENDLAVREALRKKAFEAWCLWASTDYWPMPVDALVTIREALEPRNAPKA